ncbi:unnamed protein product [Ixodes pacificus]
MNYVRGVLLICRVRKHEVLPGRMVIAIECFAHIPFFDHKIKGPLRFACEL